MFKNATIKSRGANPVEYHKLEGERGSKEFVMSSSALRLFAACPSKWRAGFEMPPSASLEYGSLFDTIVLLPEHFAEQYAVSPATYEETGMECPSCKSVTKAQKCKECKCERMPVKIDKPWNYGATVCDEWRNARLAEGKEIVSPAELAEAEAAKRRLFEDAILRGFIEACDKQVWIEAEWHDEATGLVVPVKCLIDLLSRKDSAFASSLGDLKTTKDASVTKWERWAHYAGYEIQAAWNLDLAAAATSREFDHFLFVLSESFAPYQTGRRQMVCDPMDEQGVADDIASGRRQYRRIMADYCACLKSGKWPGFDETDVSSSGWTTVSPDPYAEQRRMFAPKFQWEAEEEDAPPEEEILDYRH